MRHILTKALPVVGVIVAAACADAPAPPTALGPNGPSLAQASKITICHAAGRAGTTHYIAITVSGNATAGHFYNNGTPKAGHEDDYIATAERPCNAPAAAQLTICKESSANDPTTADPTRDFAFTTSEGASFNLKFTQCNGPTDVFPGDITITEVADSPAGPLSYYATGYVINGGVVVTSTGFNGTRPFPAENAVTVVTTTSGNLTTITFKNRN